MLFAALALLPWATVHAADTLLPFRLAYQGSGELGAKVGEVKAALVSAGFEIVGDDARYDNAHIVIFTSPRLKETAARTETGGLGAVLRAAINKVDGEVQVACVNPEYLAAGYRLADDLGGVGDAPGQALGNVQDFGSKALTRKKLGKYNYMFGMEKFDDPYELGEYASHDEAIAAVGTAWPRTRRAYAGSIVLIYRGKRKRSSVYPCWQARMAMN